MEERGRDAEIYSLAEAGMSHQEIAQRYDISRQRVGQIIARNDSRLSFTDRQRADHARKFRAKWNELQAIIDNPPAKTTAIGRVVTDPDNGKIVRDMNAVIAAVKQQTHILAEYRKMEAIDRIGHQDDSAESEAEYQEAMDYVRQLAAENAALKIRVAELVAAELTA